jgi:chromate transport protein ChrA
VQSAIQGVTLAAAGLVVQALIPLARDAITGWVPAVIAVAGFLFLAITKRDTVWVMAGSAVVGLVLLR